ncbi:MAG TPA: PDZ domain-containing protein [Nitriliruptorales bacterium]|nr:PDZ domain-containing protein [Nitriliruptorales bacterium]
MRRLLSLLVGIAAVGLIARAAVPCHVLSTQPRCYVGLHPGPATDALRVVRVEGERTYGSTGELLLTTVAVDTDLDLPEWVANAVSPHLEPVPRAALYAPGADDEEAHRRDVAAMDASQVVAVAAALRELGHDVSLAPQGAQVVDVVDGLPAHHLLTPGDVIVGIDGGRVASVDDAVERIAGRRVGADVALTVRRDGRLRHVRLALAEDPLAPGRAVIGAHLTDHVELPLDVRIDAGRVGGPSAGLMFALAVVDVLGPDDLTGGQVIAGTGRLDVRGDVQAIGGVRQKIVGAVERDGARPATIFLVPAGNAEEARGASVARGLLVVPIGSLKEAQTALRALREGRDPAGAFHLAAR